MMLMSTSCQFDAKDNDGWISPKTCRMCSSHSWRHKTVTWGSARVFNMVPLFHGRGRTPGSRMDLGNRDLHHIIFREVHWVHQTLEVQVGQPAVVSRYLHPILERLCCQPTLTTLMVSECLQSDGQIPPVFPQLLGFADAFRAAAPL